MSQKHYQGQFQYAISTTSPHQCTQWVWISLQYTKTNNTSVHVNLIPDRLREVMPQLIKKQFLGKVCENSVKIFSNQSCCWISSPIANTVLSMQVNDIVLLATKQTTFLAFNIYKNSSWIVYWKGTLSIPLVL